MYCQQASGCWSDRLLKFFEGYATSQDLVDKQTDEGLKKLDPLIVLTLAGIKLLKGHFQKNLKECRISIAKAIQVVKVKCGADANIDALCDKLVIQLRF